MLITKIQQELTETLRRFGFLAEWDESAGPQCVAIENPNNVAEMVFLEFDDPATLEGCIMTTPSGLEHLKPQYKQAFEIALGVYYASIGGTTAYSPQTNAKFNEWAKLYGSNPHE